MNINSLNHKSTLIGVILILIGYFLFSLNDALSKVLLQTFTLGQLLFFRSIGSAIILAPIIAYEGKTGFFSLKPMWAHVSRLFCATLDTICFYIAVMFLPLTDVLTFYMAGPIYVTIISHFFLNELMGWRRWVAILIGFIGVIITLNPTGANFSYYSIFALISGLSFALLIVLNRILQTSRDSVMVSWQNIVALVIGAILCLFSWTPLNTTGVIYILIFGTIACSGHILISKSLKYIPATLAAPMQYTILIWAILFDYLFFHHQVEAHVILGAAIIISSNLFLIYRRKKVTNKIDKSISQPGL
ncbi:DMT family transporter [Bartonella sp. DGB1]|uniref:DMT family transporter n=1 Tax=Bartonella sp. DGB1 TaxID=3239807 RepID=UPI003525DCA5